MNEFLQKLEAEAGLIMAPPNMVNNNERHFAEQTFLKFRTSESPYEKCKYIFENTRTPFVLFEAAETLKTALINNWYFLLNSDKDSLRTYLMNYVRTTDLPPSVYQKILQVIAIMIKRNSVDDNGREREVILQQVENLIINAEPKEKILGFKLVATLIQEYAHTIHSTDVGLSWEIHFKVKRQFERHDLKRIFQLCLKLLTEMVKNDQPYDNNIMGYMKHILIITEKVLTWGHVCPMLSKRLISVYETIYEADQAPALRVGKDWSDIMFDSQLIPLMFQVYWKVKDYDDLSHYALTCLGQLASLNGEIMHKEENKLKYLRTYIENFSILTSSITIKSNQSLGISNIIKKLILFFAYDMIHLSAELQTSFLDELTRLTCTFCEGAAHDELEGEIENDYNDAFENVLETWAGLVQEYTTVMETTLPLNIKDYALRIFNTYVKSHLVSDNKITRNSLIENEEDNECDEEDRVIYKDQLQTIGSLARLVPEHTLPILYNLLEERIENFKYQLQLSSMNTIINEQQTKIFYNIFDDLYWLLLITGHVLCMDSDGETPLIPSELMCYSIKNYEENNSNLQASLNVLASINNNNLNLDNIEQCDHIIRLLYNVMKLCLLENSIVQMQNNNLILSPLVSSTIMWFLKRFCLNYLLPVEVYYTQISPILIGVLGEDTDASRFFIDFMLNKIKTNIFYFHSEPNVLKDTIELLSTIIVLKRQKSVQVIKSEEFWKIMDLRIKLENEKIASNVHRELMKCFTLAGPVLIDYDEMKSYYGKILQPVELHFKNLITIQDINKKCTEENIQMELINLLECVIGITKGYHIDNNFFLFPFLIPILTELPVFLKLFNNYEIIVQLILEVFVQCGKNMIYHLSPLDTKKLYETVLITIQAYAECNSKRYNCNLYDESVTSECLQLILDILTSMLSKDCIDLHVKDEDVAITASDVALFGLNFLMPIMYNDILKYPDVCSQYYKLLVLIIDIYPEKICNLSQDLLSRLIESIRYGLNNFGTDIVQACLDFILGITTYFFKNNHLLNTPFGKEMKQFLNFVLKLTLTHQISSDLISCNSTCIYSLICCYQDEFRDFIANLVQSQNEPLMSDRLAVAFQNLTVNFDMSGTRQAKLKFKDNFEKFLANVQSFLIVK